MTLQTRALQDKRTCRIFFSSPFGGMEDERGELTRRYFPKIHHLCSLHGIQFVAVDMRWGITSEASSSAQVINICLRELDRSDIFVGFYGQRYGWFGAEDKALQENFDNAVQQYPWLDQYRDKSVTELEYLHGHLNNPGDMPAVICFRDKAYDDIKRQEGSDIGDKKQVFKYSAESELSTQLMDDLKKRIQETKEKTLGVYMNYKTPAEGAELMFNDIWKYLTEVLLKDARVESKSSRINSEHDAFLSSRSLLYVGNESYIQKLTANINSENPVWYAITGPAGSGKSSLLSHWLKQIKSDATYSDLCVVYHFVGAAEESTDIKSMLGRLIQELNNQAGDNIEKDQKKVPEQMVERVNEFVVCLERVISIGKTPVLVIDGVEKIKKSTKVEKPLYWLPKNLPAGVRMVISTKSSDHENIKELVEEMKFQQIEILPLTEFEQKELSEKSLMQSGKQLSPPQMERIVAAEETKNPLYLKTTLNELVVFGYFRLLDKKIDSLISCPSVVDLFDKVLERLEDDYNVKEYAGNLVEQALCSICLSNQGLSETDIKAIYNIPAHIWSSLYFALRTYIIEQNGIIRFAFTELEEAVSKRYLRTSKNRERCLLNLIQYFESEKEKLPPVFDHDKVLESKLAHELPWLYLKLNDIDGLQKSLLDLKIFNVLYNDCMSDMIELWDKTENKWSEIGEMYMKQIDLLLVDFHRWIEASMMEDAETPGIMLMNTSVLDNLASMIKNRSENAALKFTERHAKISIHSIETYPHRFKKHDKDTILNSLANQYADAGKFKEAVELHRKVLEVRKKKYEDDPTEENIDNLERSYHGLGTAHLKMHKYEQADEYLKKCKDIMDKNPGPFTKNDRAVLLMNLGVLCLETDRYEDALDYNLQCLKLYEEIYFGHLPEAVGQHLTNLGLCYRKLNNLDEAEKMYKKSIEVKVNAIGYYTLDVAMTYMNLGVLETVKENPAGSYEYCKTALEIYENIGLPESGMEYMMCRENMVLALKSLDRMEEALTTYRPFFKIAVDHELLYVTFPRTHNFIAEYLIQKELYDEAEDILLKMLDTEKLDSKYFINLHKIDVAKSKSQATEREHRYTIEYGLELFPHDYYILEYLIRDVYIPQNEVDKCVALLESNTSHFNVLGLYDTVNQWFNYSGKGTVGMLIQINLSALKYMPENAPFRKNVAVHYQVLKDNEKALPHFIKILELEPDDPQNMFWVAKCSCLLGDYDLSKKHGEMIKEKFPDDPVLIPQVDLILDAINQAQSGLVDTDENPKEEDKK
ncbi:TPR repeat-containing protein DDB_G0287407-like [Mytilus californianus]|uniref:TPR repeat-containing protein DDB_G0287407-like n=1 Tax=Mytilus californianus TaxID=6549 RepID=UPI0022466DF9|nr:TPR repeat-containing protein DDB_G0287407-like [Mytilus californianus]